MALLSASPATYRFLHSTGLGNLLEDLDGADDEDDDDDEPPIPEMGDTKYDNGHPAHENGNAEFTGICVKETAGSPYTDASITGGASSRATSSLVRQESDRSQLRQPSGRRILSDLAYISGRIGEANGKSAPLLPIY